MKNSCRGLLVVRITKCESEDLYIYHATILPIKNASLYYQ